MSRTLKRFGKLSLAIGVLLFIGSLVSAVGLAATTLGPAASLFEVWWASVLFGLVALGVGRTGVSLPWVQRSPGLDRQDVIAATNWSRENSNELRRSLGIGLAVAGVLAFLLASLIDAGGVGPLWIVAALVGVVMLVVAWRQSRGIAADHTREVGVTLPDQLSPNDFFLRLRREAEDRGYVIESGTSPAVGGREASHNDDVFLSHGSFRARRRHVAEPVQLFSGIEEDKAVADTPITELLTAIPLGLVGLAVGVTLLLVSPGPAATGDTALYDAVRVLGGGMALVGLLLAAYGYVRRTREYGELYCVIEGSIHGTDVNLYDEATVESFDGDPEPNVRGGDAACELIVTLGASSTSLYDRDGLVDDLDAIAAEVSEAADDASRRYIESAHRPTVDSRPTANGAASVDD